MTMLLDDTIAAIATPHGAGGIGVIRLSGPKAFDIPKQLFETPQTEQLTPRCMQLGYWLKEVNGERLDQVLVVHFVGPHSYTGENVVEIQAHGGRLNLEQILDSVLKLGIRPARPGEFTLRAFLHGRVDLTRAEAVQELIGSQTEAALRASRRHLQGDIAHLCGQVREQLVEILAHIEALIDFPDEELPADAGDEYERILQQVTETLTNAANSYARGRLLHEGAETMIVGRVNVGKSSLLNRLLRTERAIVTDTPGTTRDLIEATVDLGGVPLRFIDSAGLREGKDDVERIGIERAWQRLENTDFVLWVLDQSRSLHEEELQLAQRLSGHRGVLVINKCDLPGKLDHEKLSAFVPDWPRVRLSAKTGENIEELERSIQVLLADGDETTDEIVLTSARHAQAFRLSVEALQRARTGLSGEILPPELIAADLREALDTLAEVVGLTTPEEVLQRIFSTFCIGK